MEQHSLDRTGVIQYDLLRILSSQINGELNHQFYSSFVRRVISHSQKSDRFNSNSDILLKMKMAIDSIRDNLIMELSNQINELPERSTAKQTIHPNYVDDVSVGGASAAYGCNAQALSNHVDRSCLK